MGKPLISVVMAVYKEPIEYLDLAIKSILNQNYSDFEFVIVLDCPDNDDALQLIECYMEHDSRVILIKNENNIGLAMSLNKAIERCSGDFIARMDADDVSRPERFSVQLKFLISNPKVDLVGSSITQINEKGEFLGIVTPPNLNKYDAKNIIHYRTISFHPTWFARKKIFKDLNGYNNLTAAQDYDLLFRAVVNGMVIKNVEDVLLDYRLTGLNVSVTKGLIQLKSKSFVKKYCKRGDGFDLEKYEKSIKTSRLFSMMHSFSIKLLVSAKHERSILSKYVKIFLSFLLSPYQFKNFLLQRVYSALYK